MGTSQITTRQTAYLMSSKMCSKVAEAKVVVWVVWLGSSAVLRSATSSLCAQAFVVYDGSLQSQQEASQSKKLCECKVQYAEMESTEI